MKGAAHPPVAKPLRERIYARDGWTCCACGTKVHPRAHQHDRPLATLDHRIPLSRGGSQKQHNLQTMCGPCNWAKRDDLDATPEEAQIALLLCARTQSGYPGGPVFRIGKTSDGAEAWLFWPDHREHLRPAYHHRQSPRPDVAEPLQVRLESLTGWDRLGWRVRADVCTEPSAQSGEELRELPLPDGWT